jgi:HEPN domain-containing protein
MREDSLIEGRRWLEQATVDLRWAEDLAKRGGYHLACFLAQQVAEKALKGLLYARGLEIVLGHSVERLCREAAEWEPDIEAEGRRWAILDSYYVPTRYPNSVPGNIPARVYTAEAAEAAVVLAREVVEWVEAKIHAP